MQCYVRFFKLNIMKKRIIAMLSVFFLCYLLGSFYSASFNIKEWEQDCRFFVSVIGGIVSIFCATYPSLDDFE
jgi:ABC-type multidrug transport system permease subunit